MSKTKLEWKDWDNESELFRDGQGIGFTDRTINGDWWWWVCTMPRTANYAVSREEAKAAIMKEVSK